VGQRGEGVHWYPSRWGPCLAHSCGGEGRWEGGVGALMWESARCHTPGEGDREGGAQVGGARRWLCSPQGGRGGELCHPSYALVVHKEKGGKKGESKDVGGRECGKT
jgi:hypothetical protein